MKKKRKNNKKYEGGKFILFAENGKKIREKSSQCSKKNFIV